MYSNLIPNLYDSWQWEQTCSLRIIFFLIGMRIKGMYLPLNSLTWFTEVLAYDCFFLKWLVSWKTSNYSSFFPPSIKTSSCKTCWLYKTILKIRGHFLGRSHDIGVAIVECGSQSVMLTFRLIPSKLNKLSANKTLLLRCLQPHEGLRGIPTAAFGVPMECKIIFSSYKLK